MAVPELAEGRSPGKVVRDGPVLRSHPRNDSPFRRPVRVKALAVAAGAVTVPRLGHVPVLVAVRSITVLAEPCIVVEPGRMDLGEGQGRPERLGDPPGPAGVDGVTVTVVSGGALEQEVPLSWLALPHDAGLHRAGPLLPLGRKLSRCDELDAGGRGSACRARRCYHYASAIWAWTWASRSRSQARACRSSPDLAYPVKAHFDGFPVKHAVAAVNPLPHADSHSSTPVIVVSMLRPSRVARHALRGAMVSGYLGDPATVSGSLYRAARATPDTAPPR